MTDHIKLGLFRLHAESRDADLRKLACWAALQTKPNVRKWHSIAKEIYERADEPDVVRTCDAIRDEMSGAACAAAVIGLRVSPGSARSVLACMACAQRDPLKAAVQAIEHTLAWHTAGNVSDEPRSMCTHIENKLDAVVDGTGFPSN